MATRYWVGGDGNWNQPELHWSNTSGGAPSAAFLPTSADDVVFDANSNTGTSAFTVCVDETAEANCRDFSTSSLDGAMTLLMNATSVLNVYGSMTLPATNFTWSGTSGAALNFLTSGSSVLTTNGVSLSSGSVSLNMTGTLTLGSAVTTLGNFIVLSGTFTTANFNLTCASLAIQAATAKTINLGSSTVTGTLATPFQYTGSNLTFNAGTSTITCSAATATLAGGGLTFNNVEFSGGAGTKTINGANTYTGQFLVSNAAATIIAFGANQTFTGGALIQATNPTITSGVFTYSGTVEFASAAHGTKVLGNLATFQNLTITTPAVDGITTVQLAGNVTVSGTLTTTNGGSTSRRVQIVSSITGTQRTLTVGTNSLINTDFRDIIAAGTASWTFGLGYGNLGNNTGITFNNSTLYWIGGTGNWSSTTNWSTSSGGAAANAVPCAQNSVIFDANSNTGTGAFTVTGNPAMQCNDFSTGGAGGALDGAMTLSLPATAVLACYGSMTLPATNFTCSGTSGAVIQFSSTSTGKTITTNGVTLTATAITFNGVGGGWTLGSAFTSTAAINLSFGTFDTGNFNITTTGINSNATTTRTLTLGSSTVTLSAATPITFTTSTNLTLNAGTSTITCSNASPTFAGGGLTFYNVSFTSAASGTTTITGDNTFNNLTQTSRSADGGRFFNLGGNQTISGTLTLGAANTAVRRILVISNTIGTQRTITLNGTLATLADVDFRDIATAGTAGTWTGTRIGDGRNNSGITFTAAKTVYWSLAAGGNWSATAWATSSGGTPAANNFPLAQDTAIIEDTGLNTSATITVNFSWFFPEISAGTRTTAYTFDVGAQNPTLYKNFTLSSAATVTGTGQLRFWGYGNTQTITSAGVSFPTTFDISKTAGTFQLLDNLTITNAFTLTFGTLDLSSGNRTLTCDTFGSSNSNTRSISFGTGNITLTGNAATIWSMGTATNFTYAGTPTVNCTYSGSTGTRTINVGGTTAPDDDTVALSFYISSGTDIFSISGSGLARYRTIDFTGFSGTLGTSTLTRGIYGNLIFSSGMTIDSATGAFAFRATSGTQQITTNGKTLDLPLTINGSGGTVQLQDNLTMGSTRQFTLTAGTLDLSSGNRTLSCGLFGSSNSNTRSISFGTGNITLTGNNATIWNNSTATNLTYTGTSTVNCTYSGAVGIRTIFGGIPTTGFNFNISAGTDIVNVGGNAIYNNLSFTGFSGTLTDITAARSITGNLTISSGMTLSPETGGFQFVATSGTQQLTTNGKTLDCPIIINAVGGTVAFQDALTQGSTKTFTITRGTLQFKNGTTNTVGAFLVTGTGTKALQSTLNGSVATISQASGDVYADYITIKDSNAIGGANFYASPASNGGNNFGWNFANNFRYWVGGSGNWSDAATNWSNLSGGTPNASYLPTATDIVVFDANSNVGTGSFTVTVDGTSVSPSLCNDFVCGTGLGGGVLDGAMTLNSSAVSGTQLNCYGSMTLPATNLTWTSTSGTGTIVFAATTTGKTITTNGVNVGGTSFIFDGIGGGWSLGSALSLGIFTLGVAAGTFSTNNYSITTGQIISANTTNTRAISLGSSTITLSAGNNPINFAPTNLTFNAGTSSISCTAATSTFIGGDQTFYDVSFTSASNGIITISGTNTFNNLTFTSRSATGRRAIVLNNNQTVSGILTFGTTNTAIRRMFLTSDTVGTPRTVTVNGTVATIADVDFRDITAAGTYGTWSGTRLGNCLGNTNITFAAGKNVYRVGTGNWADTQWALTSGGTVDVNNFPLAQDVMIFDTNTVTGTNTIDSPWQFGGLDCSALNVAVTIDNGAQSPSFYKNIILDADITTTATGGQWYFVAQGTTQQLTTAGVTFAPPITIESGTGTLQLQDNVTATATTTLNSGNLDLNNRTLTCNTFVASSSQTRSIAFGTGNITLTGNDTTIWNNNSPANFTYTGTSAINCTYSGSTGTRTITTGAASTEAQALNFNISAGSDTITTGSGVQVFKNLNFTGFTGTLTNRPFSIFGNLTYSSGMTLSSGSLATVFNATTGSQLVTTNGKTIDFTLQFQGAGGTVAFQDALTQGSTRAFIFIDGTVKFKSGTTNTVGIFQTTGTTLKYLESTTPGVQATITTASTTLVFATYLVVQDSYAQEIAFWHALFIDNSINGGNNTNWIFNPSNNNFFIML